MMKKIVFVVASLFLMLTKIHAQDTIHVVLLAGQSNMAGHGDYDQLDEKTKKRFETIKGRVVLSVSGNPKIKAQPIAPKNGKPSEKYNFTKHFGPEIFIALTLAEAHPTQKYLFIKKAVGGTSLYGAWSANYSKEKAVFSERGKERQTMQLYAAHQNQIHQELKKLDDKGIPYKIIGMAWMQGEADTNKPETANAYEENLELLIQGYRKEFKTLDMPFVFGQVNPLPRKFKEGPMLVRKAMEKVAQNDSRCELVKTKPKDPWLDYPKHSDNLHYNHIGQERLGTDLGEFLLRLQ